MDWKEIVVTPQNGAPIPLSEVTEMDVDVEDQLSPWQADGNKYASAVVVSNGERGGTIMGGDVGKLLSIPRGTACTVSAKLYHAVNRAGAGAATFVFSNAVFGKAGAKGQSNKYAGGQVSFMCFSPDGTDPLTISQ